MSEPFNPCTIAMLILLIRSYGFTNVIIPSDIYHAHPSIWPFSAPFAAYHASAARPLPLPIYNPTFAESPTQDKHLRIASIFVYNDPRDLALDAQITLDLLLSHKGFLGTHSPLNARTDLPNAGYQSDGQPPLVFANPDLVWAASWHLPRLGSGAFKAALEGLWRAVTDGRAELQVTMGGKPSWQTFGFAEERIMEHRRWLVRQVGKKDGTPYYGAGAEIKTEATAGREDEGKGALRSVYMVGDNPASDIVGANRFRSPRGTEWTSVLVRSGVFAGEEPPGDDFKPKVTVEDVFEAVNWGLEREGMERIEH